MTKTTTARNTIDAVRWAAANDTTRGKVWGEGGLWIATDHHRIAFEPGGPEVQTVDYANQTGLPKLNNIKELSGYASRGSVEVYRGNVEQLGRLLAAFRPNKVFSCQVTWWTGKPKFVVETNGAPTRTKKGNVYNPEFKLHTELTDWPSVATKFATAMNAQYLYDACRHCLSSPHSTHVVLSYPTADNLATVDVLDPLDASRKVITMPVRT